MTIFIVDLPIKKMENFQSYDSLPEGSDHEIVDLPIE
jgi:hypothetical protein